MAWKLDGSYFETCSCDVICPCTASLALGATKDRCNATLVFNIKSGEVDGTDVSGLTVAAIAGVLGGARGADGGPGAAGR
jgi:hypothetical protein